MRVKSDEFRTHNRHPAAFAPGLAGAVQPQAHARHWKREPAQRHYQAQHFGPNTADFAGVQRLGQVAQLRARRLPAVRVLAQHRAGGAVHEQCIEARAPQG